MPLCWSCEIRVPVSALPAFNRGRTLPQRNYEIITVRANCAKFFHRERFSGSALGSRSSVIFDLDQDGDLDLVTLEMNQPPMVLTSNLSEKKELNYLKVALVESKSNKSGTGATVSVIAGNDVYTKKQDGKSGYLSQSLYPLYFGLGNHTEVDRVEVTWPSGKFPIVDHEIELNRLIKISESM